MRGYQKNSRKNKKDYLRIILDLVHERVCGASKMKKQATAKMRRDNYRKTSLLSNTVMITISILFTILTSTHNIIKWIMFLLLRLVLLML